MRFAVMGDGHSPNQLHYEVRTSVGGCTGVKNPGDIRMVHECESLPLRLESRDNLDHVGRQLHDLEGDVALHRAGLLRPVNGPHSASADDLDWAVIADHRP